MIRYNSDEKLVKSIKDKLKENDGYCPCSIVKTPNTKCMCKQFKEMKSGVCHCGLFVKADDNN